MTSDPTLAVNGGRPVRSARTKPWPSWPQWDEREVEALKRTLSAGAWGSASEAAEVRGFEQEFAAFHDAKHCACNTNGTASLEIALRAAGLRPGEEVIVPPYTFIATASAVVTAGGTPIFADIDPETYNLDPKAAQAAITPRTRGLIAVHIGGCPADLDAFVALAHARGLFLIEDCAQAHAAEWKGRKVGAIGDLGTFSFQSSKNITAGEGGAVLTDDDDLYARCWSLVNVGRIPEGAFYEHHLLGSNHRLTEFQAALLRVQLTRLPEQTQRRWENARFLNEELAKIPGLRPTRLDPRVTRHAYHLYILRFSPEEFGGLSRTEFLRMMNAEGVPCSSGYVPLYRNPAFLNKENLPGVAVDYAQVSCPVAERVCASEAVWLTQNLLLADRRDMQDIVEAAAKIQRAAA